MDRDVDNVENRTAKCTKCRSHHGRPNSSPPTVVVGIDGSRSAVDAALWAVDEAVSRDIPLRLVYAIDPNTVPAPILTTRARDLAEPK